MFVLPKSAKAVKIKKRNDELKSVQSRYFCPFFFEIINEEINALKYKAQKVSTPVNFSGFGSLKAIVPKIVDNKRKISASAKAKMQTEIR